MIIDKKLTSVQTSHCSIDLRTVKIMPATERTVIEASTNGDLSPILTNKIYVTRIAAEIRKSISILSFFESLSLMISFVFLSKCFFQVKNPTISIGK